MNTGWKALIVVLVALGLIAGGHIWGSHTTDVAWRAKVRKQENERLQAERQAREAEIRRGEKASGALQAELLDQQITNDQLAKAFHDYKRRHPILARRPVGPAAPPAPGQPAPQQCDQVSGGGSPALSLGAVWMWNSALAGRDVPAGACGLADASEGTCAVDSGISLEEAWDNQVLNARICREDRIRHQRLIDYINGKGQP